MTKKVYADGSHRLVKEDVLYGLSEDGGLYRFEGGDWVKIK